MTRERPKRRFLTIMLVPDGRQDTMTYRLSYRMLRVIGTVAGAIAVALTLVAGSWWYLAARASRVSELEKEVAGFEEDRTKMAELARQLQAIEVQYGQLRSLFGSAETTALSSAWLPPSGGTRRAPASPSTGPSIPSSWPLTERGFVTQGLLDAERSEADHPGIDIAVATDSYVRAAGAGTVVDVGEDEVYGRYVVLDHGDGYTSLYGHASTTLVIRGQTVREHEVIALSGSSGRSTAPHLHFEVLLNGEAVDPLTLVAQP